jgi:signal transduction histidine kinase
MSEESLRKNERLTTLGLLAAEIAHEIRNPLTVLKLLHGGLGLDFAEGDPRRTDMRVIGEKLDQLEAIVTRVLNFAKAPSSLHSRHQVAEIVEDTLVLIRLKLAQSKIRVRSSRRPAGRRRGPQGPAPAGAAQPPHQLHAGDARRRRDHPPARAEPGGEAPPSSTSADTGSGIPDAVREASSTPS